MLDFTAASFAMAGLAAAAGPIIIHLLNRRRFRIVQWAAMDFLREAVQRKRRILQLRDLLLLAFRVLALILLGLMLARPFFTGGRWGQFTALGMLTLFILAGAFAAAAVTVTRTKWRTLCGVLAGASIAGLVAMFGWTWQGRSATETLHATSRMPVHAVLVIDNSRSMGVENVAGTLLDKAKARAGQFIDALPSDSRITLVPLAGSVEPFPQDALRSATEARRVLDRIRLMDVSGDLNSALEFAREACDALPELPNQRVAILSDLQSTAWKDFDGPRWSKELPGLQIAQVSSGEPNNIWISRFELEDGIAGTEAPARFLAEIRAAGPHATSAVQATLTVDGTEVASQLVELAPGQSRELAFTHQFDIPGSSSGAVAELQIQPETLAADQLPSDNRVTRLAPVVAALPIVFVDQWGDQENPAQGRIGETYALRHLLAPRLANELSPRRLIHPIHVRPEQVTQELLENARLVVVAGLEAPGELMPLLHQYVIQGGPLMILAGGGFDPLAWQTAWNIGDGILPAPLSPQSIGAVPQESSVPRPFFADFQTMHSEDFLVSGEDPSGLAALFNATPFFKAVQTDVSRETLDRWHREAVVKAADDLEFLRTWDDARRRVTSSDSVSTAAYRENEARWRRLEPNWWNWRSPLPLWDRSLSAEQLVERQQPRVLAWFQGGQTPWVIERRIGAGKVLFWSSGVTSDWNLLRSSAAMYVFHRACHRLLQDTLPRRNFEAGDRIALPLALADEDRYELIRPTGEHETLAIEALGSSVSGLIVRQPLHSGVYSIRGTSTTNADRANVPLLPLAVQAPDSESELERLSPDALRSAAGTGDLRVLGVEEPLHLEGGVRRGQSLWKWCAAAILGLLILEMAIVAVPESRNRKRSTLAVSRFEKEGP